MFPRLHLMYLRRNSKKDSDKFSKRGHPFATIGVLRHPRTGTVNVAAVILYSSDKHFQKSEGRRQVLTKAFKDPNLIIPKEGQEFPYQLYDFLPKSVYGRITDKQKANDIFESLIKEAKELKPSI